MTIAVDLGRKATKQQQQPTMPENRRQIHRTMPVANVTEA